MTYQSAFTAPHYKASQVGQSILNAGGTASEAMVAAAAMISVQYPHMNSIGGDGFWLICKVGQAPIAIDACGMAASQINVDSYRKNNNEIPEAGGRSAITMAGTISGWQKALELDNSGLPLSTLLQPAIDAALNGIEVTQSLVDASVKTLNRLKDQSTFGQIFLTNGEVLKLGDTLTNPALAETFQKLATLGLDSFYRGELAAQMAEELANENSPITLQDFNGYHAKVMSPLAVNISKGRLYNLDAPTQGLASLLILAIYDRLVEQAHSECDHIHLLVEATKQAFIIRDQHVTDADHLSQPLQDLLSDQVIEECVQKISMHKALPWPHVAKPGDTVWMGASDKNGTMVSFIQSIYWEFGCGVVLPSSGIIWNIRAKSFTLDENHHNVLKAGKKPFHTLNPAYADLSDGRRMVYGTMGGEGQPQTQACLFSRYIYQQMSLPESVSQSRWLLGRTWGDDNNNLRLEASLYQAYGEALSVLGHDVTSVTNNNELMGHAGAIVLKRIHNSTDNTTVSKTIATSDPRSDGYSLLGEK
jgi:gamma-glutamyltranspeptidase/glutathione hydrolase